MGSSEREWNYIRISLKLHLYYGKILSQTHSSRLLLLRFCVEYRVGWWCVRTSIALEPMYSRIVLMQNIQWPATQEPILIRGKSSPALGGREKNSKCGHEPASLLSRMCEVTPNLRFVFTSIGCTISKHFEGLLKSFFLELRRFGKRMGKAARMWMPVYRSLALITRNRSKCYCWRYEIRNSGHLLRSP